MLHKFRYILTAINVIDNVRSGVLKDVQEQLFSQGKFYFTVYSLNHIYTYFWYCYIEIYVYDEVFIS